MKCAPEAVNPAKPTRLFKSRKQVAAEAEKTLRDVEQVESYDGDWAVRFCPAYKERLRKEAR